MAHLDQFSKLYLVQQLQYQAHESPPNRACRLRGHRAVAAPCDVGQIVCWRSHPPRGLWRLPQVGGRIHQRGPGLAVAGGGLTTDLHRGQHGDLGLQRRGR